MVSHRGLHTELFIQFSRTAVSRVCHALTVDSQNVKSFSKENWRRSSAADRVLVSTTAASWCYSKRRDADWLRSANPESPGTMPTHAIDRQTMAINTTVGITSITSFLAIKY